MMRTAMLKGSTMGALLALAVAAAGCGSDEKAGSDSDGEAPAGDDTVTMVMTDNDFEPDRVEARVGEEITFRFVNDGNLVHEALIGPEEMQEEHAADMAGGGDHDPGHDEAGEPDDPDGHMDGESGHDMEGDSGDHMDGSGGTAVVTVQPGDSAELSYVFDEPGTVLIGCHQPGHYEAGMVATVEVS